MKQRERERYQMFRRVMTRLLEEIPSDYYPELRRRIRRAADEARANAKRDQAVHERVAGKVRSAVGWLSCAAVMSRMIAGFWWF